MIERVLRTVTAAGVFEADAQPAVTELVNGPGDGWSGLIRSETTAVSFHASADGYVVAYRTVA